MHEMKTATSSADLWGSLPPELPEASHAKETRQGVQMHMGSIFGGDGTSYSEDQRDSSVASLSERYCPHLQ